MKLPFINEVIFESQKNPVEILESSFIYIYIYIYIWNITFIESIIDITYIVH